MKALISLILTGVFIGMIVLLCLFSCIASSRSDEFWEKVREELDKNGKH